MSRKRERMKGRRESGSFAKLPHAYFQSPEFAELLPRAVKALIDLYCQFRGNNNGDLCAAFSVMRLRGWRSKDQLAKAIKELIEKGWLMVTRQGGRNMATLYAVTFMPINECGGKLDVKATATPPHLWKRPALGQVAVISLPRTTGQLAPHHGTRIAA